MRALAFSVDEKYEMPFRVLWHTLLTTKSLPDSTPVYFLHDSAMRDEVIARIRSLVLESGHNPTFINAELILPDSLPIKATDHVSSATFYRLFLPTLLPQDVESVIHLDLDVVALRSARKLFELDFDSPVAAVDHARPEEAKRVFGDQLGTYFQAGILVIDLVQWRSKNVEVSFKEILKNHRDRIRWWDQDVLNIAFDGAWQRLPMWFNVCSNIRAIISDRELEDSAVFIHYDGHRKPWVRYSPHRYSEFWYAAFEDCFGYSLKAELKQKMDTERFKNRLMWPIRMGGSILKALKRTVFSNPRGRGTR